MPQTRQFNVRLEPFATVREFIERFCAEAAVLGRAGENLILIIDELSENTRRHGHPSMEGNAA